MVAGARAQYKGVGTINGAGHYGFILTAIDGDLPGGSGMDRFRIKIWNRDVSVDGSSGVVYDNQTGADINADPTMAVQGGQIRIRK